jgi:hypothetical protein
MIELYERNGSTVLELAHVAGDRVISLWAAPETVAAVRRYVERTLRGAA